ncbi:flagellar basal body P-ring formation chaperone FlgA [Faunimonas sp. B44]|uniref:flagellar basal body P-ring formation chaperone FlgA n=1 Tax=Faunimonas sp. B44 TaxID=3461493 RepID=UPI004043C636
MRAAFLAAMLALGWAAASAAPAAAQSRLLPVPTVTVYPGDVLGPGEVVDRAFRSSASLQSFAADRFEVVGKVARRTLVAGQPIPLGALGEPQLVARGASVQVVFREGGLVITAYGSALEPGRAGDVIRVRNLDSGTIINGIVQPDGSVRVGAG